jgi:hypothetical protein
LDLRDLTVVLLGAGAELGPLAPLAAWGAHVVAVDLPRPALWRQLLGVVRDSPGRVTVPVDRWLPGTATDEDVAACAGADLVTRTPDILEWLAGVEGPFTLGNYVYLDGPLHVRAVVAVDALTQTLLRRRDDVGLAFLATPTDAYAVPAEAVEFSRRRFAEAASGGRVGALLSGLGALRPNYGDEQLTVVGDGSAVGLCDALVAQQGPNYALAKRIQRWRALHERLSGRFVSLNVAPATRTSSVVRNWLLAAGFAGAQRFGVEVFEPGTSTTLMAALLVRDLRSATSSAQPSTPLAHPLELFWQGANHGGLWRTPYLPRAVLGPAVALGMVAKDA